MLLFPDACFLQPRTSDSQPLYGSILGECFLLHIAFPVSVLSHGFISTVSISLYFFHHCSLMCLCFPESFQDSCFSNIFFFFLIHLLRISSYRHYLCYGNRVGYNERKKNTGTSQLTFLNQLCTVGLKSNVSSSCITCKLCLQNYLDT